MAVVRFFMDNGFDVDARDDEGHTPLDLAQENNCNETIDMILEARLPPLQMTGIQLSVSDFSK